MNLRHFRRHHPQGGHPAAPEGIGRPWGWGRFLPLHSLPWQARRKGINKQTNRRTNKQTKSKSFCFLFCSKIQTRFGLFVFFFAKIWNFQKNQKWKTFSKTSLFINGLKSSFYNLRTNNITFHRLLTLKVKTDKNSTKIEQQLKTKLTATRRMSSSSCLQSLEGSQNNEKIFLHLKTF